MPFHRFALGGPPAATPLPDPQATNRPGRGRLRAVPDQTAVVVPLHAAQTDTTACVVTGCDRDAEGSVAVLGRIGAVCSGRCAEKFMDGVRAEFKAGAA